MKMYTIIAYDDVGSPIPLRFRVRKAFAFSRASLFIHLGTSSANAKSDSPLINVAFSRDAMPSAITPGREGPPALLPEANFSSKQTQAAKLCP